MSIVHSTPVDDDEQRLQEFLEFGEQWRRDHPGDPALEMLQFARWDKDTADASARKTTGLCAACGVRTGVQRQGAALCTLTNGTGGHVFLLCPACNAAVDADRVEEVVDAVCMRIEHGPVRRT